MGGILFPTFVPFRPLREMDIFAGKLPTCKTLRCHSERSEESEGTGVLGGPYK